MLETDPIRITCPSCYKKLIDRLMRNHRQIIHRTTSRDHVRVCAESNRM
jgi:hypothetical protein